MKIINWIKKNWIKFIFILSGVLSLVWFLVRVIPKPSRASYPCQRVAYPIASAFVIWLTGILGGVSSIQSAKKLFRNKKLVSLGLFATGIILLLFTFFILPTGYIFTQAKSLISNGPELKIRYNLATDSIIDPQATVAIVKSDKNSVFDINVAEVEAMVRKAVEMAGGLNSIITDGDTVVLKPNLVQYDYKGSPLSTEANGMVTDWRVVAATAKIVRELNPHGTILVMEGTNSTSTIEAYNLLKYTKAYIPEVDAFLAIEKESGNFQEFNSGKLVAVTLPESVKLYPDNLKTYNSPKYYLNKIYYNANVMISLPVLKNHENAGTTGAVKNLGVGGTPSSIYSTEAGMNIRGYKLSGIVPPISHNAYYLHRWIHDFYYARPADFAIMDGLQGYSYGPICNYEPPGGFDIKNQQENMRVILASKDAIALDAIEALVSGDDPLEVSHLVYLDSDGLGCADAKAIKMSGTKVYSIKKNFPHRVNESSSDATDFTAPGSSVNYVHYSGNNLNISLADYSDVTKVELELDGQEYKKIIINGFDNASIDLNQFSIIDSVLTIYAQDRFLNSDVFKIKGNYTKNTASTTPIFSNTIFNIYPNPAGDFVNIQMNNLYTGKLTIAIYNQAGKQIFKTSGNKQTTDYLKKIDISCLPKGYYIFSIYADHSFTSKNICKE